MADVTTVPTGIVHYIVPTVGIDNINHVVRVHLRCEKKHMVIAIRPSHAPHTLERAGLGSLQYLQWLMLTLAEVVNRYVLHRIA